MKKFLSMRQIPILAIVGTLAICSLLLAGFLDSDEELEALFDWWLYEQLMSTQVADIHELIVDYEWQQLQFLPVGPPDPDLILVQGAGIIPFDPQEGGFSEGFLNGLLPEIVDGITMYPITVFEDWETRDRVILNSADQEIASLAPPTGYDPKWFVLDKYPDLYYSGRSQEEIEFLVGFYDPARIVIQYKLILEEDLIKYVWRKSIQAAAMAEGGGGAMMGMGWEGGSVSNIEFTAIDWTNGIEMTIAYPDDFTNRLDIYTCSDLVEFWWDLAVTTNINASTNWIAWKDVQATNEGIMMRFYAAGNADLDTDGDGIPDAREHHLYHSDPTNASSFPVDVSGTVAYSGYQSGPIHVTAVTASNSWNLGRSTVLDAPGAYTNLGIPNLDYYWFKAYRDSNTNMTPDKWEATGSYTNYAVYLTNDLAGIDITVSDPPANVNGTVFYDGGQTGAILVIAVTSSNSWSTNNCDIILQLGPYHIPGLSQTNYWIKAFRDPNGDGLNEATNGWGNEAWGAYEFNPLAVTAGHHDVDITLVDPDWDEDGMPNWWEAQHDLHPYLDTDGRTLLGETGTVSTNQTSSNQWHMLSFENTYSNPVVIIQPLSWGDTNPAVVRLRNVTGTNTEFQIDEWDYLDGVYGTETMGYLVMESGAHRLMDGTLLDVGTKSATHSWGTASFGQSFDAAPVILSQAQTCNDPAAVVTRQKNASAIQFRVRLQEEQGSDGTHGSETVGYIAMEEGAGTNRYGLVYEIAATPDEVTHAWYTQDFSAAFSSTPAFLANMQTCDGGDVAAMRYHNLDTSSAEFFVEEEQSGDAEMSHTTEKVGYFLLDNPGEIWGDPPDQDNDGLITADEYAYGADPTVADTDEDGVNDGDEVANGTDPTDPDDPPNISGTIFYDGRQTGTIWVIAVTSSNSWSTNYCDLISEPGGYIIPDLSDGSYWVKVFRDTDGDGTNDPTEAWDVYDGNPATIEADPFGVTERVTGIDLTLIDPDSDEDGMPDWWESQYGLDPNDDSDGRTLLGETGTVSTNQASSNQWHTLSFENNYTNAVVTMQPLSWATRTRPS